MFFRVLVLFAMVSSATLGASEPATDLDYARYINARFAFGVSYPPAILAPQGEAENGDGQRFVSKDNQATMLAYGYNNPGDYTLKSVYRDAISGNDTDGSDRVVTYKVLKGAWFVVSGTEGGRVFYTKVMYRKTNDQFIHFTMTYPKSERAVYNPIVAVISHSMKVLPAPSFGE